VIFTYWSGDASALDQFIGDWSSAGYDPAVHGDELVSECLGRLDREWPAIFERIKFPACKSDIARLALLYRFGGLYVDAHTGGPDVLLLSKLFAALAKSEIVVVIRPHTTRAPVIPHEVMNGAICARAESCLVFGVIADAMENLRLHMVREDNGEQFAYNIHAMAGAWAMRMHLFRRDIPQLVPRPQYAGRVGTLLFDGHGRQPFYFHRHYGYRKPGDHWSERQMVERLFKEAL
jgi:hypothetical protein